MADTLPPQLSRKDVDAFPNAFRYEPTGHDDPYARERMSAISVRWDPERHENVMTSYSPDGALKTESWEQNGQNKAFSVRGYQPGSVFEVSTANGETTGISFASNDGTDQKFNFDLKKLQDVRYGDPQYLGGGWSAKRMATADGDSFRVWFNDSPAQDGIKQGTSINVDLVYEDKKLVPKFINRREGLRSIALSESR